MTGLTNGVTAQVSPAAPNSGLPATSSSKSGYRFVFHPLAQTKVMAASQVAAETTLKASGANLYNSIAPAAPSFDQIRSERSLKGSESVHRAFSKTSSPVLTPATARGTVPEQPLTAFSAPNLALQPMVEASNKAANDGSDAKELLQKFDKLLGSPKFDIRIIVGAILKRRISKEEILKWALQRNVDPKAIEALVAYKAITTEDLQNWNTRRFQQQSHLSKTAIPTVAATSASSSSVSTTRASAGAVAASNMQTIYSDYFASASGIDSKDFVIGSRKDKNTYWCLKGHGRLFAKEFSERPNFNPSQHIKIHEMAPEEFSKVILFLQQKVKEAAQ